MSTSLRSLVLAAALCGASPAFAEPSKQCQVWFPDLAAGCERQGRYEGFIPPMTMPYLFEEPFITTGLSGYGIWHEFPNESAFQGGDAWIVAVQARVAITDRLALIATKDGYAFFDPDNDSQLDDDNGALDISAGLKYALIDRPKDNFILTPSLRIEVPVGQQRAYSGNGDGTAIPAVSGAWGIGGFHVMGSLGSRIPFANHEQTTSLFYNLQLDYALWKYLTPFFALGGTHYTRSGNGDFNVDTKSFGSVDLTTAQDVLFGAGITDRRRWDAADILNLGSEGVAGNNLVTLAFGARVPLPWRRTSFGAAYEFPVTHREDIFDQRVTMNLLYEF